MPEQTVVNRPVFASATIVFAIFLIALQDALVKYISGDVMMWQIFVLRGVIATALLGLVCLVFYRHVEGILRKSFGKWVLIRTGLMVGMYLSYYSVIPFVDLGILAAGFYTAPIFITLLSSIFLRERVGAIGWIAVFIAFAGVACILQPGSDKFNALGLMSLVSAICYASSALLVRAKCPDDDPIILVVSLNFALLILGVVFSAGLYFLNLDADVVAISPFLLANWAVLDMTSLYACVALALLMLVGSLLIVKAYQSASPSIVAMFDYSYILYAVLFGMLFFQDQPNTLALFGIALVILGGILVLNKHRFKRKTRECCLSGV